MGKNRAVPIAASFLLAVFAVAGCTAPSAPAPTDSESSASPTDSESSASPTAQPTAAPTGDASSAPASRFDVGCSELVTDAELESLFGPNDFESRSSWAPSMSPVAYAVFNAGGLLCTWGNDEIPVGGVPNPAYKELTMRALPDAAAAQIERHTGDNPLDDAQPFGNSSSTTCFARSGLCSATVVVDDVWIEVFMQGVTTTEATTDAEVLASASPVLSSIVERVGEGAASNTVPDVEAVSARTDCEAILPAEIVQSVFGTAEFPVHSEYHSGGWGLVTGAADLAGVTRCMVGPAASDVGDAQLEMLPHGAWAFEADQVSRGVWENHESVSVDGVDQQAYMVCPVGVVSACAVDFVVDDAWVRVGTYINGQRPVEAGDEPTVLELAGQVASALG